MYAPNQEPAELIIDLETSFDSIFSMNHIWTSCSNPKS